MRNLNQKETDTIAGASLSDDIKPEHIEKGIPILKFYIFNGTLNTTMPTGVQFVPYRINMDNQILECSTRNSTKLKILKAAADLYEKLDNLFVIVYNAQCEKNKP